MGACVSTKKQPIRVPQLQQHPVHFERNVEQVKAAQYVGLPIQPSQQFEVRDSPQQNQPPNSPKIQPFQYINSPKNQNSKSVSSYQQPLPKDIVRDQTEADFSLAVKNFDLHVAVME